MKDDSSTKVSFWAYDVFGYLLPGAVLISVLAKANGSVYLLTAPHWESGKYIDYAVLVGIAYTVGHIISAFSSYILERVILRWLFGYPTILMFKDESVVRPWYERLVSPGYFRPYSNQFQTKYSELFKKRFGLDRFDQHDNFWLAWSYVAANHPVAYRRATHFLELYGFTRNMSLTFLLIGMTTWFPGWTEFMNGYIFSAICFVSACALFSNYTKLLRRLNDEVFRAFVSIECEGLPEAIN